MIPSKCETTVLFPEERKIENKETVAQKTHKNVYLGTI